MVGAQVETELRPGPGVAAKVDCAADGSSGVLLGGADRPELLEGLGAVDGGLVVTGGLEDVVRRAVAIHRSSLLGSRRGVVSAVRLDDVVLDEWVAGPAVYGEVAVAIGVVLAVVVEDPMRCISETLLMKFQSCVPPGVSRVPSLSADEVAVVSRPLERIRAAVVVGVGRLGLVVGPPGVEIAAVGTLRAGSSTTSLEKSKTLGRVGWYSECTGGGDGSDDESRERDHFDSFRCA